ncbi:uncharacterized protein F4807DRAFT_463406 [Annulohypoxylon truncatum]|uniref:uncharacterized protein n=1 Tax=Annulohypoxylon truncatum TaxID=327061 RepID=UPI00200845D3|nr:uncharacterized protein F4807DRAFT_463406 [Annulohypoxylon truncatum]KAI1206717.1 hypothetical protein F4807DRAFT_463406 [Annulohypoxylon truncatum]
MEDDSSFRYRVNYSENIAPKYPAGYPDGLEVVPHATPVYPLPAHPPSHVIGNSPDAEEKWSPSSRGWPDVPGSAATALPQSPSSDVESHKGKEKRRVLGLTVPLFWTLVVIVFIILAAALGGGIGGGLKAQQQQKLTNNASSDPVTNGTSSSSSSAGGATPTSSQPAATTTVTSTGPIPSDSGCPLINGQTYTPYAVDGSDFPLQSGKEGQQFKQQCYTNYVSSAAAQTHDILKIYMPTLENCIMACAAYNEAYASNLANNTGVGGGYCVAVTLNKINAGFCYLKNGTTTNDTMGHPDLYSSAVLLNLDTS